MRSSALPSMSRFSHAEPVALRREWGCKRRGAFAGTRLAGREAPEAGRKALRSAPGAKP